MLKMWKILQDRRVIFVFSILAILSLALLSNALKAMDFLPSQPIGRNDSAQPVTEMDTEPFVVLIQTAIAAPLWKQVVFWVGIFLLTALVASFLDPKLRRKILAILLRVSLFTIGIVYLLKLKPDLLADLFRQLEGAAGDAASSPQTDVPPPVFEPPQDSNWLSILIGFGVVVLSVILIARAHRFWTELQRSRGHAASMPLREIAVIARDSLSRLRTETNYENAIIECYDRMSGVVAKKRNLHRAHAMTSSEFAVNLTRAGLPRGPVEDLTRLFESVRYGKQKVGQAEINRAVDYLTSILAYCGETA
jgi:hypothetical protein